MGSALRFADALYKEQSVVLCSVKLGEADKIVTVMTQGSGKVRTVGSLTSVSPGSQGATASEVV
jgi:hypothetical protein